MEEEAQKYTVDDALIAMGSGKFQIYLLADAGMGWIAEAMEMMLLSFVGPAVQAEWGLSPNKESMITSVVFAGMLIGSYSWGIVSDKYGRRNGFFISAIFTSTVGISSALAPNYATLIFFRFFVGLGLGGGPVLSSWLLEFIPAPRRAFHLEALRVDRNNTQINHSISRAYITSSSQHNQSDNSTVMFEGLEIRSNLLPTLQKIALEELAERCNGDMRMAVNQLQYMSLSMSVIRYDDIRQRLLSNAKDEDISPFTAVDKLFGYNGGKLRMDERIDLSMSDLDLVPLLIQENYINYRPSSIGKDDSGMKRMSSLARVAESIADGDIINVQIRRYRQWQLSQSSCVASCILPLLLQMLLLSLLLLLMVAVAYGCCCYLWLLLACCSATTVALGSCLSYNIYIFFTH